MENNQNISPSLRGHAGGLAMVCRTCKECTLLLFPKYDCPKGISGLDMRFGKDCLCYSVSENDWLEYLKNRQIPDA